jgi:hypothetical protein
MKTPKLALHGSTSATTGHISKILMEKTTIFVAPFGDSWFCFGWNQCFSKDKASGFTSFYHH